MSTTTPGSSPYRNEIDALRERKTSLERELATLRAQTAQLDELRTREAQLAQELAGVDVRLREGGATARRLPMLDQVKVASPCNASWDDMVGDERVRFCLSCEKNVFNLSAMSREAAEQLLVERMNGELCVRFYQRADGTIMTQDCPEGAKKKRRKKLALAVAGAGAMAAAAMTMMRSTCTKGSGVMGAVAVQGDVSPVPVMGEMTASPVVPPVDTSGTGTNAPPTDDGSRWVAGGIGRVSPPPAPKPPVRPEPKRHVMGKPAMPTKGGERF